MQVPLQLNRSAIAVRTQAMGWNTMRLTILQAAELSESQPSRSRSVSWRKNVTRQHSNLEYRRCLANESDSVVGDTWLYPCFIQSISHFSRKYPIDLPFRATGRVTGPNTISESPDECCRIVLVNHGVYRHVPVTSCVGFLGIEAIVCARRCDNHHTDPMDGRRGDGCDQEQRKSQEQAEHS